MDISQFEQLNDLQDELARSCNALLRRYQYLRETNLNDKRQNKELKFHHLETLRDCPDRPYCEEWETEEFGFAPPPTDWEWLMKHADIHYQVYLGYENAHDYDKLPLRWLFDPDWEIEAMEQIGGEALRLKAIADHDAALRDKQDREMYARLQKKFGDQERMCQKVS